MSRRKLRLPVPGPECRKRTFKPAWLFLLACLAPLPAPAQAFNLPTANHALYEPDAGERFFVGTAGKSWTSGCFGCVRSGGWQIHEGLDIRCLERDRKGEPWDPVLATADGTVAYVNARPSLSNYGNYLLLCHRIEGIDIYSLYAHLREIRSDLKPGQPVKAGERLGTMGRTANTREGITKERAHLHFEMDLLINDKFAAWYKKTSPGQRNDHGQWNGQNLLALDPAAILRESRLHGAQFSLINYIQSQTPLCHVLVRRTDFQWLNRYRPLVRPNPVAAQQGVAGYEIALNFNGVPCVLIPRAASEIKGKDRFQLLSVNEAEYHKNPGRRLVTPKGKAWALAPRGINLLELLTY